MSLADKIFGTYSDRELKKIDGTVNAIMDLEEKYSIENYTDEQLRAKQKNSRLLLLMVRLWMISL